MPQVTLPALRAGLFSCLGKGSRHWVFAAVIASFYSLWLAVSRPDYLVVDEEQYRQIKSELKAQSAAPDQKEAADKPDSAAKRDHD